MSKRSLAPGSLDLRPSTLDLRPPRRAAAFTLVEVMFSILLLGIGLVAIASLFPIAGTMQQATADDVFADQVGKSAMAMLLAKGVDEALFNNPGYAAEVPQDGSVFHPGDSTLLPFRNAWHAAWPMADRSFPSTEPMETRDYYWVPLFRRDPNHPVTSDKAWEVYIFVMKAVEGMPPFDVTAPPGINPFGDRYVIRSPLLGPGTPANAGDWVVDPRPELGAANLVIGDDPRVVQRLTDTNPDATPPDLETRWHGMLSGTTSTAKLVLILDGGVVR